MKHEIFIPGPLPGMNEIIAASKRIIRQVGRRKVFEYTKMKYDWTVAIAKLFYYKNISAMESIVIDFIWLEKDRQRNPDNIAAGKKFVIDGLVKAGVIKNDGWSQIVKFSDAFAVSKDPGVIVRIWDGKEK